MPAETPLSQYIIKLCGQHNLSLRQASIRSGLAPETISKLIRRERDGPPRPDTLQKIAQSLGGDYEYMMVLAGHLVQPPTTNDVVLYARFSEIARLLERIAEEAPELLPEAAEIIERNVELLLRAHRSSEEAGNGSR